MQVSGGIPMKIVILDGFALNPGDLDWSPLSRFGEVTVYERTGSEEEAIQRIGKAQIVLTNKVPITAAIMDACPSVKLICEQATGYNNIDIAAAAKRGITVCNVPSYSTDSVAQLTFALLLEICHNVGLHNQQVHNGAWCDSPDFCFWSSPLTELSGKTLGIVGLGSIGQAVARIGKAFGMRILAFSRTQRPECADFAEYVSLDQLLAQSDVVSLHCPLFPETAEMINETSIGKMKDGAILLNTSRGGLVNEAALAGALRSGKLRAAAVDVVSSEPMTRDNPLLTAPNCYITPHIAWAPLEARIRLMNTLEENIRAWLIGAPQNVVN